jgi:hypothetical protein
LQVPEYLTLPLTKKPQVPFCSTTRPSVWLAQLPIGAGEACALASWLLITPSIVHATAMQRALKEKDLRALSIFLEFLRSGE